MLMATEAPGITHLTGLNVNFFNHRRIGNTTETMMSCPISIPILKDNSEWLDDFHLVAFLREFLQNRIHG